MAHETQTPVSFTPVAKYYSAMDLVLFLREDCSYRADRVDTFLTVLWHPDEDRLVGIKLKGVRFLFERLKVIAGLNDSDFVPLIKVLEIALVGGMTESALERIGEDRLQEMYREAREVARDVGLPSEEWQRIAA